MRDLQSHHQSFHRHWPLFIALALFWAVVALILVISVPQTAGHVVYVLDDAYIHLAIAKNLAEHGIWGVTEYGFSSSASSLIWPVLLAGVFLVVGPNEAVPLVLNVGFATLVIVFAYVKLHLYRLSNYAILLTLVALILFTPLPLLVFVGMEHSLQVLVVLLLISRGATVLARGPSTTGKNDALGLAVLACVSSIIRYESLFVVLALSALFCLQRRWTFAIVLSISAILPIAIYGLFSVAQGWFVLPNSLLLKAPSVGGWERLPAFMFLVSSILSLWIARPRHTKSYSRHWDMSATAYLIVLLLHTFLVTRPDYRRYEAYLVAVLILIVASGQLGHIPEKARPPELGWSSLPKYVVALVLSVILPLLMWPRFTSAMETVTATVNIYEQQYQMGLFVRDYYQGSSIAVNDIGAINYIAGVKCLDLWGLGSLEAARLRLAGAYDTDAVGLLSESEKVRIGIVYESWFSNGQIARAGVPPGWIKTGTWQIRNRITPASDTVAFFATSPEEQEYLVRSLNGFAPRLPPTVIQRLPSARVNP